MQINRTFLLAWLILVSPVKSQDILSTPEGLALLYVDAPVASGSMLPSDSTWLRAWYEADDLDATYNDGNNIVSWANKSSLGSSGNLINFGSRYPVFYSTVWNGHDVVSFQAADFITNCSVVLPQPLTIMIALRFAAVPSSAQIVIGSTNASGGSLYANSGYVRLSLGTNVSWGAARTNWTTYAITANNGQATVVSNGVSIFSGNCGLFGLNGLTLGAMNNANFFNGHIGTFSVYGTNLPASDMASLFSYMTNLYPIQP